MSKQPKQYSQFTLMERKKWGRVEVFWSLKLQNVTSSFHQLASFCGKEVRQVVAFGKQMNEVQHDLRAARSEWVMAFQWMLVKHFWRAHIFAIVRLGQSNAGLLKSCFQTETLLTFRVKPHQLKNANLSRCSDQVATDPNGISLACSC